nr:hypothetical protein GCM10025699_39610 [Microbacterium flavescens]
MAVIVLLVPLQATAEEYAFRGFAMQALGSWIAWPVVAIVLPTRCRRARLQPVGAGRRGRLRGGRGVADLAHGRPEAAIVAHVLNNVVLFLLLAPFAGTPSSDGSAGPGRHARLHAALRLAGGAG